MTTIKLRACLWTIGARLALFYLFAIACVGGCGGGKPYRVYNTALELVEAGEIEQGEIALHRALTYDPQNAEAWNQLGIIAFERGMLELARERFQTAMRLDRLNAVYPRNLAMVFAEWRQFDIAEELLARSLELDVGAADSWVAKAKMELLRGDKAAAEEAARSALIYAPGHNEALDLLARLRESNS